MPLRGDVICDRMRRARGAGRFDMPLHLCGSAAGEPERSAGEIPTPDVHRRADDRDRGGLRQRGDLLRAHARVDPQKAGGLDAAHFDRDEHRHEHAVRKAAALDAVRAQRPAA